MAKAIEKFTLSAARNIPLDKLVLNQQTVRKLRASLSIEDLAQDIAIADCSPASASGPNRRRWQRDRHLPHSRRGARCCAFERLWHRSD